MTLAEQAKLKSEYPVVIIGGGQAGLCVSHYLKKPTLNM